MTLAAVAVGGALGASARWAVGSIGGSGAPDAFPWPTFTVNVVGCLLIGIITCRLDRDTVRWHFVATGVLGGFTTMSAFAVEANRLADAGRGQLASGYVAATFIAGFLALLLGERIGASAQQPRPGNSAEGGP
jgi:CrcB protein